MISLDSASKILKKYGYNSKNVHPYLYKKNKEIGVNYSYIDNKYGITERVISFHNDIDLDLFLKKYQWFKLNGKKHNVTLKLNNYEVANPEVLYIRNNHVMTDNEMFNIDTYDKNEVKSQKLSHTKRLLLEADNLMVYYYNEKNIKEKYTNNLFNKEKELKRYYLELQKLIDKYNKVKYDYELEDNNKTFKVSLELESKINSRLAEFKNKLPKEENILELINDIWNLNKMLESNNSYLYALRYNDDIDEEMRVVVTKIDFMKELLSKKSFRIVNLKKQFDAIDKQSTYESIYDDNFETKYKEFIEKKYNVRDRINEFRLAEYLNNFRTIDEYDIERNVDRCKNEITTKVENFNTSVENINKDLTKQFNTNLNEDEKNALILYNSYYRELFEIVQNIDNFDELEINDLINLISITGNFISVYDECYTKTKELIENECNKKIRETIFKNINFDNQKKFIESILNVINIIANINNKMILKDNFKLYFSTNDFDTLGKDKFIYTSTIISPFLINKGSNYRVISADIRKGISVLYSPKYIALPVNDNLEIKVMDNENPEIILDTRDIIINKDKNIIVYSKFKSNKVENRKYTYIDNFELNYKINISKVLIEKRNKNGK